MASLRRDPVNPLWPISVKDSPARATKNPALVKEKQGPQKLRAMADPLYGKVSCPALGESLGVLRLKDLRCETFLYF
jgi:hypothetical protein